MGDVVLFVELLEWLCVCVLVSELFGCSKDLWVVNLLLQSNVVFDGLDGFVDGLLLVCELFGQYWDGVYLLFDVDDDNDFIFCINVFIGLVVELLL